MAERSPVVADPPVPARWTKSRSAMEGRLRASLGRVRELSWMEAASNLSEALSSSCAVERSGRRRDGNGADGDMDSSKHTARNGGNKRASREVRRWISE